MKTNDLLLEKYNKMVPRYTSYPPANFFTESFKDTDYLSLLDEEDPKDSMALYFHIPFCEKICFYCGCNKCSLGRGNQVEPYLAAIRKEMQMIASRSATKIKISEIHFGGGTPNTLSISQMSELMSFIYSVFDVMPSAETAIECHPGYLTREYLDALLKCGFNRFSLGIQDFDTSILKGVNREPSALPVKWMTEYLKSQNPNVTVNLDFIYGLPGQTVEGFAQSIDKAIEIRPDRLVTFSYAHVPWMKKNQTAIDESRLPSAKTKTEIFEKAREMLLGAGYRLLGMDHYVLPEDSLFQAFSNKSLHRNFQGYCTTKDSVLAFGSSSISQLKGGYVQNIKDVTQYIKTIESGLLPVERGLRTTSEQAIVGAAIEQLMCNNAIDWQRLAGQTGYSIEQIKDACGVRPGLFADFEQDGLLICNNDTLSATPAGEMFIRNIAACIDPLMQNSDKRYSKLA
jgi:oxygen-independent coproporphyrinogen-3 oxidase